MQMKLHKVFKGYKKCNRPDKKWLWKIGWREDRKITKKKKKLKAAKTAKHLKKQQAKNPIKLLTTYKKNADINKQETNWLISNEGKL